MSDGLTPFSSDGATCRWVTPEAHAVDLEVRWDNEAWTVAMRAERERVEGVLRVSPSWGIRQFLLFRDLDQPDLWLANDGHARWGEINSAISKHLNEAFNGRQTAKQACEQADRDVTALLQTWGDLG